ncbi:MAG: 3-isopropylmalate/(R)-2-methylmalate dehydratase small subunit [Gammaproteobacteria bacterium]|jgi:3-isopropylmalate/(R)-2-methylmalate dehydratase small subunit
MESFTELEGVAVPLDTPNVDTDQITPARFLAATLRERKPGDMAHILFHDLRFDAAGSERAEFVLNQARFRDAEILVGAENFGCGSSRETAVWALFDYGIRAVIAPSFGDIFYNNAGKNGVLAIRLDAEVCERMRAQLAAKPGARIAIDLASQKVIGPDSNGTEYHFDLEPYTKKCLLEGLDDLDIILGADAKIRDHEARHREQLSWLYE